MGKHSADDILNGKPNATPANLANRLENVSEPMPSGKTISQYVLAHLSSCVLAFDLFPIVTVSSQL